MSQEIQESALRASQEIQDPMLSSASESGDTRSYALKCERVIRYRALALPPSPT